MDTTTRKLAWAATFVTLAWAAPGASAEEARPVVLRVCYGDRTPAQVDAYALGLRQTEAIYARIGIALVPAEQPEGAAASDAMHLTVVMVSGGGIEQFMKSNPSLPQSVLGVAPDHTGRVYLFWDRIVARARSGNVRVDRVVGRVLAHEIGHHLLPAKGHSDAGLMRAWLNYQTAEPPAFTDDQVDSMRALLIAAN
jgi:hypothetical protein